MLSLSRYLLFSFPVVFIVLLMMTSCSTSSLLHQQDLYLHAYQSGNLEQAEQQLDSLLSHTAIEASYTCSKESSWLLLDQATTCFANGKIEKAIENYTQALASLDYYQQNLPLEQTAKLLLQDDVGAYQASDFEQVLARIYFALALLHQGEMGNAYALLRQAEEYPQNRDCLYAKIPFMQGYHCKENGWSKYLFALLLERRGDRSNAHLLYEQARTLLPDGCQTLCHFRASTKQATLVVICHNGNVPYKVSTTCPGSIASASALEFLLNSQHVPFACSTLMGIPVPILKTREEAKPLLTSIQINQQFSSLYPVYSIQQAAIEELNEKMPLLAAKGMARLLLRRYALHSIQKQDPGLGLLADLTLCLINQKAQADLRSWRTLPALIEMTRLDLEAGQQNLTVQWEINGCRYQGSYLLNLRPQDLCIIHIFNIHPGISRVLIPDRYLIHPGEFL